MIFVNMRRRFFFFFLAAAIEGEAYWLLTKVWKVRRGEKEEDQSHVYPAEALNDALEIFASKNVQKKNTS